jgi:hypothetical protein
MSQNEITTGTTSLGLHWARRGEWRVAFYAEGGWAVNRLVPGIGWCLEHHDEPCPDEVVAMLCEALGHRE